MIDINMTLVAQIFNFLVLVAILYKVAYKPLLKVLDEREAKIAGNISAAEEQQKAAENFTLPMFSKMLRHTEFLGALNAK